MHRKIKVIHIGDKFGKAGATIHGVTRLFSWWFTRWDTSEFDVDLVGLRPNDPAFDRLKAIVPGLTTLNKGKFNPVTLASIIKLIAERHADIVHLHGYGSHNFGRMAAKVTGARVIIHEHFVDPYFPIYQRVADRLLSPACDHGFAVSKSVKKFMTEERYLAEDKVEVLYNGAPLSDFNLPSAQEISQERLHWGITDDCLVLGSVGRLDEQKGNTYFVDAVAELIKRGRKVKALLVGDGPLADDLRRQSEKLGISQHVSLVGYQANIPLFQSIFDVQVFPSLYEGTPLTLFEAMAMGKAIVSTDVDGLGEVLVNDRNALVVPARDSAALANALDKVLREPEIRSRLAAQARNQAKDYDIQRMITRMQDVYVELMRS